eukprot:CCRYP_006965-RC/>CCRYP_006965-RC protein AED:0.37 eAED:1.00 QI:0/-1/0/1/-1/0/1/0/33
MPLLQEDARSPITIIQDLWHYVRFASVRKARIF